MGANYSMQGLTRLFRSVEKVPVAHDHGADWHAWNLLVASLPTAGLALFVHRMRTVADAESARLEDIREKLIAAELEVERARNDDVKRSVRATADALERRVDDLVAKVDALQRELDEAKRAPPPRGVLGRIWPGSSDGG